MKMKGLINVRTIFVLLCFCVGITASAQVKVNVKGGISANTLNDEGRVGYRLGMGVDFALSKKISIQPSLFFAEKGGKTHSNSFIETNTKSQQTSRKTSVIENYLIMPIDILFHIRFNHPNRGLILSVGPYVAYGIGGNTTIKTTKETLYKGDGKMYTDHSHQLNAPQPDTYVEEKNTYSTFGKDGMDFRKFDAGINFEIHFALGHFMIGNYMEIGLTKVDKNDNWEKLYPLLDVFNKRNITMGASIGYRF